MASERKKVHNFTQQNLNSAILNELNEQRKTSKFCDVILKVFEAHIPAHSNVLAAGSPYIGVFLAQTLPRQYSQAAPQVIELQIHINDKDSQGLYQIAVQKIVDFIYTSEIELTESDNAKILMIARILQIVKIVEICENFANPVESRLPFDAGGRGDAGYKKREDGVATFDQAETISELEGNDDVELEVPQNILPQTSTDNNVCSSANISSFIVKEGKDSSWDSRKSKVRKEFKPQMNRNEKQASKLHFFQPTRSNTKMRSYKNVRGKSVAPPKSPTKVHLAKVKSGPGLRRSSRQIKPNLWHVHDSTDERPDILEILMKEENIVEDEDEKCLVEQDKTDDEMNPDDDVTAMDTSSGNEESSVKHFLKCDQCDYKTLNTYRYKRHLSIHAGGKYSCEHCSFTTTKLKELSLHQREHQHEQNLCSFCDFRADTNEDLQFHLTKHEGPFPHFCEFCDKRFKTQTQLKFHVPKHSDEKPFVCSLCEMGFKWKHALKSHMIVHSAEKNHLCDVCGYATAHKSQLKAHHLLHTGETFKCNFPGCKFQAIKKQNLKYHQLTHTREKPHQCEICGQSFSLVKNLRRHMMLHSAVKPHQCEQCTFSTTRYDKLKEHLRRQHSVGKTVTKRTRGPIQLIAEMVSGASAMSTNVVTTCAGGIQTIQTEQLVPIQQRVLTMNSLGQAQQLIITPDQQDENAPKLTTFTLQKGQVIQTSSATIPGATLEQLTAVTQADNQNVMQTVELGDAQQQILPSSNLVALRPVQFLEIQFPTMQNVQNIEVVDIKQDV